MAKRSIILVFVSRENSHHRSRYSKITNHLDAEQGANPRGREAVVAQSCMLVITGAAVEIR